MGSNGEEEKGGHLTMQPNIELCATPCHKARIGATLQHEESDETIEWIRIMRTIASKFCRRPACTTIFHQFFVSSHDYATDLGHQHKVVHEAVLQMEEESTTVAGQGMGSTSSVPEDARASFDLAAAQNALLQSAADNLQTEQKQLEKVQERKQPGIGKPCEDSENILKQ
eukprot:6485386-Amphidinium_carterae.4